MKQSILLALSLLAAALFASVARAAPLSLSELAAFDGVLECRTRCTTGKAATLDACLAACPAADGSWDKDKNGKVEAHDQTLAYLEYWDAGALQSICYENAAVVKIVASDWVDYLQVAKMNGHWVIVNVLWEQKPKAAK